MVRKEKTRPPRQGVDESSRHGPRREVQAGLPPLTEKERDPPSRLPEDVEDRFRVK